MPTYHLVASTNLDDKAELSSGDKWVLHTKFQPPDLPGVTLVGSTDPQLGTTLEVYLHTEGQETRMFSTCALSSLDKSAETRNVSTENLVTHVEVFSELILPELRNLLTEYGQRELTEGAQNSLKHLSRRSAEEIRLLFKEHRYTPNSAVPSEHRVGMLKQGSATGVFGGKKVGDKCDWVLGLGVKAPDTVQVLPTVDCGHGVEEAV